MYTEEMSFMGLSNSELFLTQKDSKPIKSEFLLIPTFEFLHDHHLPSQNKDQESKEQGEEFLMKKILASSTEEMLMISKMPTTTTTGTGDDDQISKVEENEDQNQDGFRTPTSLDYKIRSNNQQCPPAPMKPKSLPCSTRNKRKASSSPIFKIDLSKDITLLKIPHHHQADRTDYDLGSKIIKKIRSN